jgi:hypothetical protein
MFERRGVEHLQLGTRQFAGAVARQFFQQNQRPGQEDRVDPQAQRGDQLPVAQAGGDDESGQPGDAIRGFVIGQEKGGIDDAGMAAIWWFR